MKVAIRKVAIQGERGSYSHEAAERMAAGCMVRPCSLSVEVFDRLVSGSVDAAVIPIENSLAGSVAEHLDLLLTHCDALSIEREFRLRIAHTLIALPGTTFKHLRKIYSHPVALAQCRNFFRRYPKIQAVPFYDTAGSVKHLVENRLRDTAAIASRLAAQEYGAQILKTGLEDHKQNFTRFFLITRRHDQKNRSNDQKTYRVPRLSRKAQTAEAKLAEAKLVETQAKPSGEKTVEGLPARKVSLAFGLRNVAGALFRALGVFARAQISLTKIESRPVPGRPWEYIFFADVLVTREKVLKKALRELDRRAEFVKVLGRYPPA